jgi:uncharacterized membrane protein YfcA
MLTVLVFGLCVGIVLGLTGAGGGILAVPALVFSQGWTVAQAAPIGLLAVTGAAMVGAGEGFYHKLVRYRAAFLMALAGVPMTPLGLAVAQSVSARWLAALFGLTMLIVAIRLLKRAPERHEAMAPCHINPDTGRLQWTVKTAFILSLIGAFTGFLTGLLGVGGGFVLVPALRKLTDISMHGIVATSLLVIALVGSGSIMVSVLQGNHFPMAVALPFIIATAMGMFFGRLLIRHLPQLVVQRLFAVLVIGVAGLMFYRAIS